MYLTFSESELRDVKDSLDRRVHELYEELVHTDDRHYRAEVRATLDRLEGLEKRLTAVLDASAWAEEHPD